MKQTKITNTNYLRTGYGETEIKEESYLEAVISYDENGKVLKEVHYTPDGNVESVVENEFDAEGRVVASSQFDENEELCQKNTFTYQDGRVVKKGCFYGEGSPEYVTRFIIENGLVVREDSYDEDEFDYTEKTHEYDENGREVKTVEFNEEGEILYRNTYEYDADGRVSKRFLEEPMEHDSRTFVYGYDEAGHKTKELMYNYDEKLLARAYFTYNEDGNVTDMEEENLDVFRRTHYTYEGKNCVKIEQFDKEDDLMAWAEYVYDDQDEVVQIKNFIHDEVEPEKYRVSSSISYDIER